MRKSLFLREKRDAMRILAVSDEESKRFFDYYKPGCLDGFDMILSCGDLHPEYLEFLVTMAHCPLICVHGNHDENYTREPEGCICAADAVITCKGLRIVGLGGSYRYREGKYMYTERQMQRRLFRLGWRLRRAGGFDILLTHAPLRGLNDLESLSHRGFSSFRRLLERWEPRYFIHGHVHRNYGVNIPQRCTYGKTTVINAYEYCVIELPDGPPVKKKPKRVRRQAENNVV